MGQAGREKFSYDSEEKSVRTLVVWLSLIGYAEIWNGVLCNHNRLQIRNNLGVQSRA
jgi:hypothetical protein